MNQTPLVSVIIPVYKVEKYLRRALDSVLAQTYQNFEAVCVNDGSPDNCGEILAEYALKDPRIKVITQENQGVSAARDHGISQAQGKYITFLDSDDAMHPQTLEISLKLLQKEKADMVSYAFEKSDGGIYSFQKIDVSRVKYKIIQKPLSYLKKKKYKFEMNIWTKLYKKELLKDVHFIPRINFEDLPWICAILAKRPKTIVADIPLIIYTVDEKSRSHEKGTVQHIKDFETGVKYVCEVYKNHSDLNLIKRYFLPEVLKHQLNRCRRASAEVQNEMYQVFAEELCFLKNEGLLSWRGHKLKRYLTYQKLIKKANLSTKK